MADLLCLNLLYAAMPPGNLENTVKQIMSRVDNLVQTLPLNQISGPLTGNTTLSGVGQPQTDLVYADDGHYYETIEEALTNADEYISIGTGEYQENLTITTPNMTIEGTGRGTVVDGGNTGPAFTIDAEDVTIRDIDTDTTISSGEDAIDITSNGSGALLSNIKGIEAGDNGIDGNALATDVVVRGCRIENADNKSIDIKGDNCKVIDSFVFSSADDGIRVSGQDSSIISCECVSNGNEAIELAGQGCKANDNTIDNPSDRGIAIEAEDCQANDNRIAGTGNDGILLNQDNCKANSNSIRNAGDEGIDVDGASCDVNGNTVIDSSDNGIDATGDDSVVTSNIVKNSDGDGIRLGGSDQIASGNRVGGSGEDNIDQGGATNPTVTDNNTSPLN